MKPATKISILLGSVMSMSSLHGTDARAVEKNPGADQAAIKKVIEEHVAAFNKRQPDANLSFWVKAPYVSHSYVGPNTGYIRGFDKLSTEVRAYMAEHPASTSTESRLSDFVMHVNGTSAWVTFVQDRYRDGKRVGGTYEARYMEKIDGAWKIAAVVAKDSAPPAPPKETASAPQPTKPAGR